MSTGFAVTLILILAVVAGLVFEQVGLHGTPGTIAAAIAGLFIASGVIGWCVRKPSR
jgi:excisionase family DNA binding protein